MYTLKAKSDAPASIIRWLEEMAARNLVVSGLTTLRTDNGGEFVGEETQSILRSRGIVFERCAPYSHVYMVERAIRTVQSTARSMLLGAGIAPGFWAEALHCAVYVVNRLTNKSNGKLTKYQLLFGRKPIVSHLRTFGCVAFNVVPEVGKKKWDPRGTQGIFLGYGDDHNSPKTYKFWSTRSKTITLTRNIIFDESFKAHQAPNPDVEASIKKIFPTLQEEFC